MPALLRHRLPAPAIHRDVRGAPRAKRRGAIGPWTATFGALALCAAGTPLWAASPPPEPTDPAVQSVVDHVRSWLKSAPPDAVVVNDWKMHVGDLPNGGAASLDDSAWQPVHVGADWGPENSIAWFRTTIVTPEEIGGAPVAGHPLDLETGVDDDGVTYVNGREIQHFHWDAGHVRLTKSARPGERFVVAIQGINGPGQGRLMKADLEFPGLPTPAAAALNYLTSEEFTIWLEGANPARAAALRAKERTAATAIPVGLLSSTPPAALAEDFRRASAALADPSTRDRRDNLVGYAHTDIDWLWQWPETKDVWYHTGMTLLTLMQQFPALHFSQTQAVLYQAMQQEHPDLFRGIQAAVRAGRWEPLNGWCENDMNMPSGESQIRQALLSNEFYKKTLGVTSDICWRPDSFGHAWTLPMILKGVGVKGYYFCRAGHGVPIFWWQSPDGSRILAFNDPAWYNATVTPETDHLTVTGTEGAHNKQWLTSFGVGDHGGGPTRDEIITAETLNKLPALPQLRFTSASEAFRRLRESEPRGGYPVISDEMNPTFQGCYTSHVDTKRMNRTLEHTLYAAETWSSVAGLLGKPYPVGTLHEAWYDTLRNQFHDILAGSNIHPSYEFAKQRDALALGRADGVRSGALQSLASLITTQGPGTPLIVFNSLGWPRTEVVHGELAGSSPAGGFHCSDGKGGVAIASARPLSNGGTEVEFVASDVPAMGYRVYWLTPVTAAPAAPAPSDGTIENGLFRINYDPARGVITGIFDKAHNRPLIRDGGAADLMQVLWEGGGNAWDLGPIQSTTAAEMAQPPRIEVGQDGAQTLVLTDRYDKSTLVHRVTLRPGIPRVDFDLHLDWQETHTPKGGAFLKTAFDTAIDQPQAWWEIPFGAIHRPAGGQEAVGLKWMDVDATREETGAAPAVPVDLSRSMHASAFSSTANSTQGSFDDQGLSYPASILPRAGLQTVAGVPYLIPDATEAMNNVVAHGQTIAIPSNQGGDLYVLGAANNGSLAIPIQVRFRNGKQTTASLPLSDWVANDYGQTAAFSADTRIGPAGSQPSPVRIWVVRVSLPQNGPIESISLPDAPHAHLFAVTIGPRVVAIPTFGVALINDGSYGSDANGALIRLSVIRSAGDPDPIFDVGQHTLRYALYPHNGGWQASGLARQGWSFNTPLEALPTAPHPGRLPSTGSFLSVRGNGIVTTALKEAEDGDGLVLRFYNDSDASTRATIRLSLPQPVRAAWLADMKETRGKRLALNGQEFSVPVAPWSAVTVRLDVAAGVEVAQERAARRRTGS